MWMLSGASRRHLHLRDISSSLVWIGALYRLVLGAVVAHFADLASTIMQMFESMSSLLLRLNMEHRTRYKKSGATGVFTQM